MVVKVTHIYVLYWNLHFGMWQITLNMPSKLNKCTWKLPHVHFVYIFIFLRNDWIILNLRNNNESVCIFPYESFPVWPIVHQRFLAIIHSQRHRQSLIHRVNFHAMNVSHTYLLCEYLNYHYHWHNVKLLTFRLEITNWKPPITVISVAQKQNKTKTRTFFL